MEVQEKEGVEVEVQEDEEVELKEELKVEEMKAEVQQQQLGRLDSHQRAEPPLRC